jgi:ABC-2 type transport system permease protein
MHGFALLLWLSGRTLRNRLLRPRRGELAKGLGAALLAALFMAGNYLAFRRILALLVQVEGLAPLLLSGLAERLLSMVYLAILSMLFFSNILVGLATLYRSRDLPFLLTAPLRPAAVFLSKFLESLANSSALPLVFLLPVLYAYGETFAGGPRYYALLPLLLAAFLLAPAALGALITLLLMRFFPASRTQALLTSLSLVFITGLVIVFRLMRPERLLSPSPDLDLAGLLASLTAPARGEFPSGWIAQAQMALLEGTAGDFFQGAIPLAALAVVCLALLLAAATRFYPESYNRSRSAPKARGADPRRLRERLARLWLKPFNRSRHFLLHKDLKLFVRDNIQWTQLFLLAALVAIYLFNLRVIPLPVPAVQRLVSFLNLALTGFILAAVALRFAYPAVSQEGKSYWILRSAPMDPRAYLRAKLTLFLPPLLLLALLLVWASNLLLAVDRTFMLFSLVTVAAMTVALTCLGLGLGAALPNFQHENPAQIAFSGGGLLYMILSLLYIGGVLVLEARPVFLFATGLAHQPGYRWQVSVLLGAASVLTALTAWVPYRLGLRALAAHEL